MPSFSFFSSKKLEWIFDRETYIEELLRQEKVLQNIGQYSNGNLDFADISDAHSFLVREIEREQERLREEKQEYLPSVQAEA